MTRDAMLRRLEAHDRLWDMVIVGGGATGAGHRRRCGLTRLRRAAARAVRLRQGHLEPKHQTGARRRALPRAGQRLARDGSAEGARHYCGRMPRISCTTWPSSSPATSGGSRRSTASASSSTISCRASTGSDRRAELSKEETLERLPTIRTEGLRGGVVYYDGQFDDSRLLINLVTTAAEQGATLRQLRAGRRIDEGRRRLRERRRAGRSGVRARDPRGRARRRQRDRCLL